MRAAVPIAAFLVAACADASSAGAEEVSPETRAAVERAFLDGRMADLPALVPSPSGDADAFTASMFGWRDGTGNRPRTSPQSPYMRLPSHDFAHAAAPYPLILAFLQDRDEREIGFSVDAHAKPTDAEASFAALPDPDGRIRWVRDLQRSARDPVPDTASPDPVRAEEARRRIARADDLMGIASVWGAASLAVLVVLTLLAGVFVRPRRSAP